MSAFMVSDDHITAICTFACDTPGVIASVWVGGQRQRADGRHLEMFLLLKQANYDSLTARYDEPEAIAEPRLGRLELTPMEVLVACDCLDYQCCEVANWDDTDAAKTIRSVREAAIHGLPGYDKASKTAWGIEEGTADYRHDRLPLS